MSDLNGYDRMRGGPERNLVKRLQQYASQEWCVGTDLQSLFMDTAGHIEQQDKRIAELSLEIASLRGIPVTSPANQEEQ